MHPYVFLKCITIPTTKGPYHGIRVGQFCLMRSGPNPKTMTLVSGIIQLTKTKRPMQLPVENSLEIGLPITEQKNGPAASPRIFIY